MAFASSASNLVDEDTNGFSDIFVHDRNGSTTELITVGGNGNAAFVGRSIGLEISADGRFVVFESTASNLVTGDNNETSDIFVYDQITGTTNLVTQNANGESSEASSTFPSIDRSGRVIAFSSFATDLANDGTPFSQDVFVSVASDPPTADALTVTTNEDTPVAFTVTGSDPDDDALTFEMVTQPTNGELTGTPPDFVYTPNADFFGVDEFTFSVNDGTEASPSASVFITVTSVNDAPVGAGVTNLITAEDTPIAVTLVGTDVDGDPLTYVVTSAPTNGNLSGTLPNLTYLPAANFSGSDSFSYTVSDGALTSAAMTISLTVTSINDGPVAVPQSLATSADTPLAITLTGSDNDNDSLSFAIVSSPLNGTLSGTLPNVLYTPSGKFVGTDSFTFTVSDGTTTSAAANVSVAVSVAVGGDPDPGPDNRSPVADAQTVSALRETPVSISLTGSDADGDTLAFNFVAQPANGSLSGVAPNLVYTPDANFVGADSFTFTVSDAVDTSAPVAVSITVTDATVTLFSAVLPASRSVEVGATATAFATLINAGSADAQGCGLRLPDTVAAAFFYQATDPATNAIVGQQNLLVDIPAGGSQSFVFGITPSEALSATEIALEFQCANATDAASFVGLNTLLLSASFTPVPDLIALVATTTANGVMELGNNNGFFTAATINVGSAATITVTADTGDATLPMTLSLCQTDPETSACINPTVPSSEPVIVEVAEGGTPTFAVFASADGAIALDPANTRAFLRFSDELGEVRGATSVAVENTQ